MIYLDANFFVLCYFDNGKKGENARSILDGIVRGKKALTSVLAMDEVMWVLIRNKKAEMVGKVIEGIYSTRNLAVEGIGKAVPLQAIRLIDAYHLKPRDAFHAAIMQEHGITTIVSDDSDFDRVKWIKRVG